MILLERRAEINQQRQRLSLLASVTSQKLTMMRTALSSLQDAPKVATTASVAYVWTGMLSAEALPAFITQWVAWPGLLR